MSECEARDPAKDNYALLHLAAANARGIVVTNTPEVLSFATAECAFTLMLMAARRAGEDERMVRAGKWKGWAPTQLLGVTLEWASRRHH